MPLPRTGPNYEPKPGSGVARILAIAEALRDDLGRLPKGREVGRRYAAEGGNPDTAETHYSKWIKKRLMDQARGSVALSATVETEGAGAPGPADDEAPWLTMTSDGRVLLPPGLRQAMRLDPSGALQAEVVDGELRLRSPAVALEQARRIVQAHSRSHGSLVDELIAERRAEAARE